MLHGQRLVNLVSARLGEVGSAGYGTIRAGALERSNVDLTNELVDLIAAQRNFRRMRRR